MAKPIVRFARAAAATVDLRWLYVDFNSYFASVEQQLNPALRGKPIAIVPVETDATCAIAASYEAKGFGVRTGTPIYEAKKICPGIICVLARHEHYVDFHHRILEEVEKHMPVTAVCSIDEVACRLMKNENSPERAIQMGLAVKAGIAKNIGEYVRCSIGIAPNRYLAKVATDIKKPDGLTILQQHDLPNRLFTLSLRDLPGIGHSMEARLHSANIWTVEQLMALDTNQMRRIWGNVWGEKMWYLLRGFEMTEEETNRSTIGHSHVMAPEMRDPGRAVYIARRLMLKAASRLRRMDYYASSVSLSLRLENGIYLHCMEKCYRAQDSITFLHLLNTMWERLGRESAGVRIKKLSVTLFNLIPAETLSAELFDHLGDIDTRQRGKWERMSRALDAINHRYGRDTVSLGMLPADGRSFSGTKVAFTRIPDIEEFLE